MKDAGPRDVVVVSGGPTIYTFTLEAGTPVRVRPTPSLQPGFLPKLHRQAATSDRRSDVRSKLGLGSALKNTNRAYVVDSAVDPAGYKQYRADLAALIAALGFKLQSAKKIGTAEVSVWVRQGTEPQPG